MKKTLLFLVMFTTMSFAQVHKSIHQLELERHKETPTSQWLIGDRTQAILPLQTKLSKAARLNVTVFGYLPYWSTDEYLHYDLLTHIACFSVEVNGDGTLGDDHGWPWTNLINKAHRNGVKVILVATLFGGDGILNLITSQTNKERFFRNIKNKILEGKADGVNIDFEGFSSTTWRKHINGFMAELTEYLHRELPGSEVSFAGPAVNWSNSWDLVGLAASCDAIFIMGYDFNGKWSTTSGPNSPLTGGYINITNTLTSYNQYGRIVASTPEKLILGIPYYGLHWKTASANARAAVTAWVGSPRFSTAQPASELYGLIWDNESQTPWYRYNDGDNWHQVWFDNDSSLGLKYNLARTKSLQGVGMWALGYDGNRQELWNELEKQFGSGQEPVPDVPLSFRVLAHSATSLRVQFEPAERATGYFAYLSSDGLSFPDSVFLPANDGLLNNLITDSLYFIRIRAVNATGLSQPTEVLAGIPSQTPHRVLVVNGFDRTGGTVNKFNYIRQHGRALKIKNIAFSSCSNEAIYRDHLSLRSFAIVDWMLGDESTADDTFNPIEQDSVKAFLRNGGNLFVSGSEIGWDLVAKGSTADKTFYADYLKAKYISDAPNNKQGAYYTAEPLAGQLFDGIGNINFDDGTHGTFDVDWPDAIVGANGGQNCLKYVGVDLSKGGAGVVFGGTFPGGTSAGRLVHLAVPFETIYPESKRVQVMEKILSFFQGSTSVATEQSETAAPHQFVLYQNFPNPFNPSTHIAYNLPERGDIRIEIFNSIGERVYWWRNANLAAGYHQWEWSGRNIDGQKVSSGVYFYRVIFTDVAGHQFQASKKMILID